MNKFKINQTTIFFIIIIVLVLGGLITYISNSPKLDDDISVNGKYDQFALCLKESGAVFYGAFWCSHCNATKDMFGSSAKLLPYVECSTPNGQGQLEVCQEKNIEGYPTWEFADGSQLLGEVTFEALAEKTSCRLPE